MIKLSIIIPFFNTYKCSQRVLTKIKEALAKYKDVEFILVNDGSTDSTYEDLLMFFSDYMNANICILNQRNKGPGGARNAGLYIAKGEFVWFIDSDDDFYIDIVYKDLCNLNLNIDFIDYNYIDNGNVINLMKLQNGDYSSEDVDLYKNLSRIVTKVFKKSFLIGNNISFPEYCIYEDNYLVLVLPKYIKFFRKSEKVVYIYLHDFESITNSRKISTRYFDRVVTSYNGIYDLASDIDVRYSAFLRFNEIFLKNTFFYIIKNFAFSEVKTIYYLISTYNFVISDLHLNYKPLGFKSRLLEVMRFFLPKKNHIDYFYLRNKRAWRREL